MLNNSSLLGRSSEHKFQPLKIESLNPSFKPEQPPIVPMTVMSHELVFPGQGLPPLKPTATQYPTFSMAPVFNSADMDARCVVALPRDFEEFKHKIERTIEQQIAPPKMSLREINRMTIVDDALEMAKNSNAITDAERLEIEEVLNTKFRKYNPRQKQHSIAKYHNKKEKRKNSAYIRYKIRQDLAGQRVRNKGKFVRNERPDLKKLAEEFMRGGLIRAANESGIQWPEH